MFVSETPALLGALLVTFWLFFVSGKAFIRLLALERPYAVSPFYRVATGMGLWYVWALLGLNSFGLDIAGTWYGFIIVTIFIWFLSLKVKRFNIAETHLGLHFFVCLMALLPLLSLAMQDAPVNTQEFAVTLRNLNEIMHIQQLPTWEESWHKDIALAHTSPAYSFLLLPVSVMLKGVSLNAAALFNVIICALMSGVLLRLWDVSVRWSNLPLTIAGGIIAVGGAIAFTQPSALVTTQPWIVFSAVAVTAFLPLMRHSLESGAKLVPSVLMLAVLVGLSPVGIVLWGLFMILWLQRSLTESKQGVGTTSFTLFVMVSVPALVLALWARFMPSLYAQEGAEMSFLQHVQAADALPNFTSFLQYNWQAGKAGVVVIVTLLLFWAYEAFFDKHKACDKNISVPALMVLSCLGFAFVAPDSVSSAMLAFVIVIPFGAWFMLWYDNSTLKDMNYKAPWGVGVLAVIVVVMAQMFATPYLTHEHSAPEKHVLQVGEAMRADGVEASDTLAVWHGYNSTMEDHYNTLLRYGFVGQVAPFMTVDDWVYSAGVSLRYVYLKLKNAHVKYLWIHSPDPIARRLLGAELKGDTSYLFEVSNDGFVLVNQYAHPQYKRLD